MKNNFWKMKFNSVGFYCGLMNAFIALAYVFLQYSDYLQDTFFTGMFFYAIFEALLHIVMPILLLISIGLVVSDFRKMKNHILGVVGLILSLMGMVYIYYFIDFDYSEIGDYFSLLYYLLISFVESF